MKSKAIAMLVAFLVLGGSLLMAEGQKEGGAEAAGTQEKVTLTVWDRVAEMETVVDMFNTNMEDAGRPIEASFELIPYDQQVQKFMSSLSAGRAPDIYSLDLVQFPYFVSINAFADITERFNQLPFKDELSQGILQLGKANGRVHALPYELDVSHIMWNKDMFREAGLDPEQPPRTWDELVEYSKALTKDTNGDGNTDQWGFAVLGNSAGSYMFWFMPFVWNNGGSMFDNEGNVTFHSDATEEALQLWHDLVYEHEVAPRSSVQWSSGDRYNAFVSERLAIYMGGNFNITSLQKDAPDLDYGVALMPKGKGEYATFGGGNLIGITNQAEDMDAAWQFMEHAFSREALVEAFAQNMVLIPRPSFYDNKYFNEIPAMSKYGEFLQYAQTPYTQNYNKIYDPVLLYLQGALLNEFEIGEAVKRAHEEIEKLTQ
jgi:multiple sugar transport system substrate-binding protein